MTDVFAKSAERAKASIEKKGRTIKLFKLNEQPDNAAKPWQGSGKRPNKGQRGAEIPVIGVFVPLGQNQGAGLGIDMRSIDGRKVRYSQTCLIAGDSIPSAFSEDDVRTISHVDDSGRIWSVKARGELRPANLTVLYALGLEASA